MLSLPFVTLAIALLANAAPMVPRDDSEPVVTTIVTWRDCNYDNPPGVPIAPCPPYPYTETVTLSPTGDVAEPTLTLTETEPEAKPTASETATETEPEAEETASESTTETETETEAPIVTTIWENRDCNYGNPPDAPIAPCPTEPWSTVITITPTATTMPVTVTESSASTATTSAGEPIVTTIWEERDCNYGKPPGAPKAPCPPYPWSTVITITPTATTIPVTVTESSASTATTSAGEPIVTTIWEERDCNYGKPPGAPKAPCPPYPWSTVVTITPTPTATTTTPTPTATGGLPDFPPPETEEELCPPPPGWDSGKLYVAGNNVFFHNRRYTALWETLGDLPDNNTKGVWQAYEPCSIY